MLAGRTTLSQYLIEERRRDLIECHDEAGA